MRYFRSFFAAMFIGSASVCWGDPIGTAVPQPTRAIRIPELSKATLGPTPAPASPAGIVSDFENQMSRVQQKISARMRVLTNENAAIRNTAESLNKARAELVAEVSSNAVISQMDAEHRELLKDYAQLESRFNRFRIHWMTHNKPVQRQDGSTVSSTATPLKGCPDCQKNFDRFLASDPLLLKEYEEFAAQMLVDLQRKRALLLPMTVRRAEEINRITIDDPRLQRKRESIMAMEQKLSDLQMQDEVTKSLHAQLQDLRMKMVTSESVPPPPPGSRSSPRGRSRLARGLGLRAQTRQRKYLGRIK